MSDGPRSTVGGYLATRLEQVGIKHYFAVPGDYNLILLDEFLKNPNLQIFIMKGYLLRQAHVLLKRSVLKTQYKLL